MMVNSHRFFYIILLIVNVVFASSVIAESNYIYPAELLGQNLSMKNLKDH
jgi:hypothetical protein